MKASIRKELRHQYGNMERRIKASIWKEGVNMERRYQYGKKALIWKEYGKKASIWKEGKEGLGKERMTHQITHSWHTTHLLR
jgi:hypothetical protein